MKAFKITTEKLVNDSGSIFAYENEYIILVHENENQPEKHLPVGETMQKKEQIEVNKLIDRQNAVPAAPKA